MEMNRQLFALGGIYPRGWPGRPSEMLAECLIEGAHPEIEVEVRFHQTVERQVLNGAGEPVDQLVVTGHRYCSGEEIVEKELRLSSLPNRTAALTKADSERMELVEGGAPAGTVVWHWEPSHATVEAWAEEVRPGLHRVKVMLANRLEWDQGTQDPGLMRTLRSAQVIVESADAAFASRVSRPPRPNDALAGHPAAA
ncbi:MAG TPA: hypothetical protein VFM94_06580 [Solirubrobacterales bacterium]|nr:hypothetical protein [Solirubrobacterales bacterium]